MKSFAISNVCRLNEEEIKRILLYLDEKTGTVDGMVFPISIPIPSNVLYPRQVRITDTSTISIPCKLKYHRDTWITVLSKVTAESLVVMDHASWIPQSVLIFSKDAYLSDGDVIRDTPEWERVNSLDVDGVIIGMIGEIRSPLAFVRNAANGHYRGQMVDDHIEKEAEKVMAASNIFLVE